MNVRARLVLSSGLMLFLELALIRWLSANVVHLGYFSNFVLLGSFLGVGLGFLAWKPNHAAAATTPDRAARFWCAFVCIFPVDGRPRPERRHLLHGTDDERAAFLARPARHLLRASR